MVHLGVDHPGANDPEYRARRSEIATAALAWRPGEPAPAIEYTDREQEVWRIVCRELAVKHERYACRAYREAAAALALPRDAIPGLDEVTALTRAAHRLPLSARRRTRAARGVLRRAGRPRVPLHPVHPPLGGAAVHAGAGPDPRGDRPREPAGLARARRAEPPCGSGRPPLRDRPCPEVPRARVLVHDRVRSAPRGRRAARVRRRHPLELRRDRGVPPDGDPADRLPRDGHRSTTTSRSTSRCSTAPSR